MTEQDTSEFDAFIETLPKFMEAQLDQGVATSTAFYTARRAGWGFDEIVYDTLWAIRTGGGPGVVINRLKGLGERKPTKGERAARVDSGMGPTRVPPPYVPEVHPVLDPEHFSKRVQLLYKIKTEKPDPDTAEQWMRDLIASQNNEPGV